MGLGLRVFILDDNLIKRIPFAKYDRLCKGTDKEGLPEYAGERIRVAIVVVETENRKPIDILHIDCEYFTMDKNGNFCEEEEQQKMVDALKSIDLLPDKYLADNVINMTPHFALKKFKNKYMWIPTESEIREMQRMIFQ